MKSILIGMIAAACPAVVATFVLDSGFQRSARDHLQSDAVRL